RDRPVPVSGGVEAGGGRAVHDRARLRAERASAQRCAGTRRGSAPGDGRVADQRPRPGSAGAGPARRERTEPAERLEPPDRQLTALSPPFVSAVVAPTGAGSSTSRGASSSSPAIFSSSQLRVCGPVQGLYSAPTRMPATSILRLFLGWPFLPFGCTRPAASPSSSSARRRLSCRSLSVASLRADFPSPRSFERSP